jgi:hypothetical protein
MDDTGETKGKPAHPLPASGESRPELLPEHLRREKGTGEDPPGIVQPEADPVTPRGRSYPLEGDDAP